jgi:hypothetical protein
MKKTFPLLLKIDDLLGPSPLRLHEQAQQVLLRGGVGRIAEAGEHRHDGGGPVEEEAERSSDPAEPRAPK